LYNLALLKQYRKSNGSLMTRLLVSVRSVAESEAALAGGADLIDIKEPAHGSLGRADVETMRAIIEAVGSRRPISAAMGELLEADSEPAPAGVAYLKWGLAGCNQRSDWPSLFAARARAERMQAPTVIAVPVAYADWERAKAPRPLEVIRAASGMAVSVVLVDTCIKDGSNLLDWLPLPKMQELRKKCLGLGLELALAGALDVKAIRTLLALEPDWIAVRGAACRGGRMGEICPELTASFVNLLRVRA
jgi:(5-formylfuran-3-yl)methyl phosphate synthase